MNSPLQLRVYYSAMPAAASMRGKRQALEMGSCLLIEDGGIGEAGSHLTRLFGSAKEVRACVLFFFFVCVCPGSDVSVRRSKLCLPTGRKTEM